MLLLRNIVRLLALPLSIAALIGGIWQWSFMWFFGASVVIGIAMADQRLGIEDPLDMRHFIPGKRSNDVVAGIFAFAGSIFGFGIMYLIGTFFA